MVKETRVEEGMPVQVAATVFTEGNLLLSPGNEKYRKLILASARRYGFTPHALAALIDAEAAICDGAWDASSFNKGTNAAGLTQFLRGTWLEMVAEPRSLMHQRLKQEKKFDNIVGERDSSDDYCLYGVNGNGKIQARTKISSGVVEDLLEWRFNPEYAIDTAALYGKINLEKLAKRGLNIDALAPEDLAKVMYLAHHEGAGGAVAVIKGMLTQIKAQDNLPTQLGNQERADALFARFNNNYAQAYSYWLYTYADAKINVAHFMVKVGGAKPKGTAEIAQILGMPSLPQPAEKAAARPPTLPIQAGAAEGWHDPLNNCTLRTALLASVKGATFGMTRTDRKTGKPKPHQGIDLKAAPGASIYAVANGKVAALSTDASPGKGYGRTLTLAVDLLDLPRKQRDLVIANKPDAEVVYFFYAHLTEINVAKGKDIIAAGALIGTTGDTGNANGMSTINKGAHLHFEVRLKLAPGGGLSNRIDPKPFINNCN